MPYDFDDTADLSARSPRNDFDFWAGNGNPKDAVSEAQFVVEARKVFLASPLFSYLSLLLSKQLFVDAADRFRSLSRNRRTRVSHNIAHLRPLSALTLALFVLAQCVITSRAHTSVRSLDERAYIYMVHMHTSTYTREPSKVRCFVVKKEVSV